MATPKTRRGRSGGLFRKSELSNGLRIVTETIPSVRSISLGVWADVGSRFEAANENGMTHFIEHMLFKGTKRRNAREIAASLENLGGSLNAFTSREQTCYTARILDEHLTDAIDVLADITCHATFTPTNMNRERLVIVEEIKESHDNPSDRVHDLFAETFWGGHPLGRPILGPAENIVAITRKQMRDYYETHYRTPSVVIAAAGSIDHEALVSLVNEHFAFPEGPAPPAQPAKQISGRRETIASLDNQQAHLCLGFPGVAYDSRDRLPALVLNAHLGGGMSSVLFQKVREEKGLAYSVYTYLDFYRDSGIFGAYVAADADRIQQAYDIVLKELRKVRRRKLSVDHIEKVKAQIKGQLTIGLESTASRMSRIARMELMMRSYQPITKTLSEIDKVTSEQVRDVAERILDEDHIAVTVLGPMTPGDLNHPE